MSGGIKDKLLVNILRCCISDALYCHKLYIFQVTIDGMWPPRLLQYVTGGCVQLLLSLMTLVTDTAKSETSLDLENGTNSVLQCLDKLMSDLPIFQAKNHRISLTNVSNALESVSEVLEVNILHILNLNLFQYIVI